MFSVEVALVGAVVSCINIKYEAGSYDFVGGG